MDKRTKILAAVFGVFIAYALVNRVVYPAWIEPLLTIDQQIAKRQKDLDRLEEEEARVEEARYQYRVWAGRVGAFDQGRVVTEVRDRLNRLIDKHKLEEAKVSPSRPVEDRKTGLTTIVVTVSAVGTLESSVQFMRDVAELPELSRILNTAVYPAGSSRRSLIKNRVNLRVPVELWVIPQRRVVGRLEENDLVHPDSYVRHLDRDYSRIWGGEPFSDYVPLRAQATPAVNVEKGKQAKLDVKASGGTGEYTFKWTPATGLSDAAIPGPSVDTSEPGMNRYTVTVTDARGHTAQATVSVTVREPPPVVVEKTTEEKPPPPPPPPSGPARWPDGKYTDLRMALMSGIGSQRLDEFMVYNSRSKETSYYKVGDPFDDGELVFVHQTGGLVRRKNEYFVYPLGATLDERVAAKSAGQYPELMDAAERHHKAVQLASQPTPNGETKGGTDAGVTPGKPATASPDVPQPGKTNEPEGEAATDTLRSHGTPKPADEAASDAARPGKTNEPEGEAAADPTGETKKPASGKVEPGDARSGENKQPPPKKRRPTRQRRTRRR